MKVVFLVQSEGRGHLSQAIAISGMLRKNGIEVAAVIVGKNNNRILPAYFVKRIQAEIHQLESFSFVFSASHKGVNPVQTILQTFRQLPAYLNSVRRMQQILLEKKPDVILNFYEPLNALHFLTYPLFPIRRISIGHQYLGLHSAYAFPENHFWNKTFFKFYTRFTALGSTRYLALSSRNIKPENNISVVPPLLRPEVSLSRQDETEKMILAYAVLPGFMEEIQVLSQSYPEFQFHVFSDRPIEDTANLSHHLPDDRLFLYYLSRCEYYLSTAGFESVCEAMFLRKKIFLVPVAGHFEQLSNAVEFSEFPNVYYGHSFLEFHTELPFGNPAEAGAQWIETGNEVCWKVLQQLLKPERSEAGQFTSVLSGFTVSE